ncbi:hypothetical protein NBRC116602_06120 [Hyphomicrobiales bacterium 4NK60-0047b]
MMTNKSSFRKPMKMNISVICSQVFSLCFAALFLISTSVIDYAKADRHQEAELEKQVKQQAETEKAQKAITSLTELIQNQITQKALIKKLKSELRSAREDVSKKEIEETLKQEIKKEETIEEQISTLTSGVSEQTYKTQQTKKFNLQDELQGLAEPFVKMIKSSTENARQIDELKQTISEAKRRQTIAKRAITRIEKLQTTLQKTKPQNSRNTKTHLKEELKLWSKRNKDARTLENTSLQQLRLKEEAASSDNLENYATSFIRTRGVNLLFAILTFVGTFMLLRAVSKIASIFFHKRGIKHSFYTRLTRLIFEALTIVVSTLTMMFVLNYLNDWILLGVAGLFTIALAWIGLNMLPVIIEQSILLLNLGAVQEGERLMIDGVPWFVKRLDHYTVLENPDLDGGHFSVPIRELVGRHSRPPADDEAWFPTKKDDWVQLENETIAKVIIQTPELVQLIELGGARITFKTTDFLDAKLRNLSTGFRIKLEFGISYKHQKQATTEIPTQLRTYIEAGISKYIGKENIRNVEVEVLRAGPSSIDYEIEADFKGNVAPKYEDLEAELSKLMIEACNTYDLEIPFPQLVIHQPANT